MALIVDGGLAEKRGLVAFAVAFMIITSLAVSLRLFSRRMSAARFWWDDLMIVLSLLSSYGSWAIFFIGIRNGMGNHLQDTSEYLVKEQYKTVYAAEIHYPLTVASIKVSLLLFYLRLFGSRKIFRRILHITQVLVLLWCLTTEILAILNCVPIHYAWVLDIRLMLRYCRNTNPYLIATSVVNVVFDFWILILPLSVIWTLQLSCQRKAALSGIFLIGTFVCAASVARAYTVSNVDFLDITYSTTLPLVWSDIEISLGIICACLPTLGPIVHRVHEKLYTATGQQATDDDQWPSQFSRTADRTYGFEQSSPRHVAHRIAHNSRASAKKDLPSLPYDADWSRDTIEAGSVGMNSRSMCSEDLAFMTVRGKNEYTCDNV